MEECTFTRKGLFNTHNSHMWATTRTHAARPQSFHCRFSINVWERFFYDNLVVLYLLLYHLGGKSFRTLLRDVWLELIPFQCGSNRIVVPTRRNATHFSLDVWKNFRRKVLRVMDWSRWFYTLPTKISWSLVFGIVPVRRYEKLNLRVSHSDYYEASYQNRRCFRWCSGNTWYLSECAPLPIPQVWILHYRWQKLFWQISLIMYIICIRFNNFFLNYLLLFIIV